MTPNILKLIMKNLKKTLFSNVTIMEFGLGKCKAVDIMKGKSRPGDLMKMRSLRSWIILT